MPWWLAAAPSLRLSSVSPSAPDMIASRRRVAPAFAAAGMRIWPPSSCVKPAGGQPVGGAWDGVAATARAPVPAAEPTVSRTRSGRIGSPAPSSTKAAMNGDEHVAKRSPTAR